MSRWKVVGAAVGLVLAALTSGVLAAEKAKAADKPVTPEIVAKLESLIPDKATVPPAQPRKLLVLIATRGSRHTGAMQIGAKAFELMGAKTGAWDTFTTDDAAMLAADPLKGFDAVLFNNCTGNLFDDPALRASLLAFVKGGKGLMGVHAATDCFANWPDYGDLIGGYFGGHLPGKMTVSVRLDDPGHPLNAAFGDKGFEFNDEIYMIKDPYSRDKLRILQTIDVENCGFKGDKRADKDFAMAWVRSYGQGRVFYSAFGHDDAAWYSPVMLRHWMDGVQFVLGDLKCDTTPSAKLKPAPAPARGPMVTPATEKPKAKPAANPAGKKAEAAAPEIRLYAAPAKKAPAAKPAETPAAPVEPSALKPDAEGWLHFFDGKTLDAWQKPAADKWKVTDGILTWEKGCGSLWTRDKFGNFVVDLEYKVTKGSNSGVFLRSPEGEKNWLQGSIEIQIMEPGKDGKVDKHTTGAIYDCLAPSKFAEKPAGEWNHMVITAKGNSLRIDLNDQNIIDADLGQWTEAGMNPDGTKNKFKTAYKDMAKVGYLGLQDHGSAVWYRNVKIKPLP